MILYPKVEHTALIRGLWKQVFEDSDAYLDLYFSKLYAAEHSLIIMEDSNLCASLQMLPCSLSIKGKFISAAYIFAVMTAPNSRRKGYMTSLMESALKELKNKNVTLAVLIPQEEYLFGVYAKYGFKAVFELNECELLLPDSSDNILVFTPAIEVAYEFYVSYYSLHFPSIIPSRNHFETVCLNLKQEGGLLLAIGDIDIKALCFLVTPPESVTIIDILAIDENAEMNLLSGIRKMTGFEMAVCKKRAILDSNKVFGMACILDEKELGWNDLDGAYMSLMMND